jgi:hypothetical protein
MQKANGNIQFDEPSRLLITGYGKTHSEKIIRKHGMTPNNDFWKIDSTHLLKANIFGMTNAKCMDRLGKQCKKNNKVDCNMQVPSTQLCAMSLNFPGYDRIDTCQGDSGGPLIFEADSCMNVRHSAQYTVNCRANSLESMKNGKSKTPVQYQLY